MTTPIIGEGEKLITTVLLNGERLHVRVHAHANGQNVFDAIVHHIGLNEIAYFGLMIIKDGEQQFLNLDEKLNKLAKYAPHLWKDDGSCNSSLVFTVFFRVKYYVENICLLQEQQTRHQYYLQLRKDVLESSIRVHDDTSMVLASYALQAELGDYDKNIHGFDYFIPQHYLPAKTIAKLTIPYIKNALPAMHQSHRGLTEGQAEIEFLKEAQKLSEYGVLFHRVYKKEYNRKVPYNLGICVRGLVVYEETGPVRNPVCKHPWSKIKKMSFKRSKFIVEADSVNPHYSKMMLYTASYKRSRYLLKISSSFFNFQMMMTSRLAMLPEYLIQEEQQPATILAAIPSVRIDHDMVDGGEMQGCLANSNLREQQLANVTQARETQKPKPKPKLEVKQYNLDLTKREGSFGFSIVGGIELGGIFVKDVTPGGPAAQSGILHAGDRIVQINKDSFENVTRREALNTLRNAPDKSKFIMETFGQNLIIEADSSIVTPLAVSVQSLGVNQPQIPVVQNERESEYIRVDLPKRDNSFGIGFTGGPEFGGVYVKSLLPHGAAETDGRIAIADRIIEIDQTNVENFTRKKVGELLRQSPGVVSLVVERCKQIPNAGGILYIDHEKVLRSSQNFTSIILNKKNDSLGFSITGGLDLGGIFVKYLNANGPAALDGRLEVGDRVVAVNDISLETASRQKALEIIRNATSPVNLIIEKCVAPGNLVGGVNMLSYPQMTRSDSIKSLPTNRAGRPIIGMQSCGITYSMQHLPNVNANIAHDVNGNYKDLSQSPTAQQPQGNKSVQEVFVVDLTKQNGSFGLSLTGGIEMGGIYVKAIQPGGGAERDGRILKGDRVVEINARRMEGLSRADAIEWLKASEIMATLVLERISHFQQQQQQLPLSQYSSFDGEFFLVELLRKNKTFGLNIMGGPELRGIFIKNILLGSTASSDSRLAKGDRIVEINGISMEGLSHHQAHDLLKQAPASLNLLIEKIQHMEDIPPMDADVYTVELRKSDCGFGFSITGGTDIGGTYIKGILPGGPADSCRKILKGDRLMEVSGISCEGLSKQQVSDVLRKSPTITNLVLDRNGCYDNIILPESEFFTVELYKKQNGYGLSLTGGPEIDGVYVKQVQRDSAADQDGRIKKGDRLITINGRNVQSSTKQKCTEMLKLSQDIAVIHLERCVVGDDLPPLDTVLTVVELARGPTGFGISLTGGPDNGGIFVKALMQGGAAEKDGRILVGDRVVEMNSMSLDGNTRHQATELLKNSSQSATFVLERYKQTGKSALSQRKPHVIPKSASFNEPINPPIETVGLGQQFSFPLYTGAAPSVPPRHHNNGIPSRESAFKRLEQQQQKIASQSQSDIHHQHPDSVYYHGMPVPVQHNVQGTPVSSRIPSLIQRQHSIDRNAVSNRNVLPPEKIHQKTSDMLTNDGLNLIAAPMQIYMNSNQEVVEDSPHRFIQQLSKSVAPSSSHNNNNIQSRIPLGPISSAIFGNTRDNRNVHEIHDLRDNTMEFPYQDPHEIAHSSQENNQDSTPNTHDVISHEARDKSYSHNPSDNARDRIHPHDTAVDISKNLVDAKQEPFDKTHNYHDNHAQPDIHYNRDAAPHTMVCLQNNGKPYVQTVNGTSPMEHHPGMLPQGHNSVTTSKYVGLIATQEMIVTSSQLGGHTTSPASQPQHMVSTSEPRETHLKMVNQNDTKKPGLTWISLNANGTSEQNGHADKIKSNQPTGVMKKDNHGSNKTEPAMHYVNSVPVRSSSTTTVSSGIPVPLASKFHTLPSTVQKSPLGGDFVFEVTLFKGHYGLGMNLAGGGSIDNPVTIKKIASGTAADDSGQLRVGDILLEINGTPVEHLSAKEVISILRACPSEVQLLVKRCAFDRQLTPSSTYVGL